MLHPVKECIIKTGLTHNAFAVLYGISFQRLKDCLYGYTTSVPQKIVMVLIQYGHDEQEIQMRNKQWRLWKAEQELVSSLVSQEGRSLE